MSRRRFLQAAFQRQPLARKGWEAMTPVQRRNHLLGIFYYQSAECQGAAGGQGGRRGAAGGQAYPSRLQVSNLGTFCLLIPAE